MEDNSLFTVLGSIALFIPLIWPFIIFSAEPFGVAAVIVLWVVFFACRLGLRMNLRKAYIRTAILCIPTMIIYGVHALNFYQKQPNKDIIDQYAAESINYVRILSNAESAYRSEKKIWTCQTDADILEEWGTYLDRIPSRKRFSFVEMLTEGESVQIGLRMNLSRSERGYFPKAAIDTARNRRHAILNADGDVFTEVDDYLFRSME
jgi:hypothetical protein